MKIRLRKLLLAVLVFNFWLVCTSSADLAKRINGIIQSIAQQKVEFSIHIIKPGSDKAVYSYNGHKALMPASNMKIVTTAAGLEYLGSNFQYRTEIGLAGDTLVVIGSGDPLLGDDETDGRLGREKGWIFKKITDALKDAGQEEIKDIIVDSTVFDDERVHPNWPKKELNRWYACEVAGLNYNGNYIEITAEKINGKIRLLVEPPTNFVDITNKVRPIEKGSGALGTYRLQPAINEIVAFGKCRKKQGPIKVAIERPAAFFGFLLAENLAKAGIAMEGQLIEKKLKSDAQVKKLFSCSTKLCDVLVRCNKDSFGLAAESLFKTIAVNGGPSGDNGSWEVGRELISQYLSGLGVDEKEFFIDDGSGLSRENKLSANAITVVLLDVYESKNWSVYKDSLAAGAIDGTISKYFKEEKYQGKIFGKTGYINEVKSFSGLCRASNGDYLFAILANNTNGRTRAAINDIAKAIIDEY